MSQAALLCLMKALQKIRYNRRVSGWSRLGLLFVAAIFLSLWVAAGYVDADMLFQSPASPPAQPGVDQAAPVSPVNQPPAAPAPTAAPPAIQPGAPATPAPPSPPTPRRQRDETPVAESNGPSNFILDQAELIDTVVVSGAYVWLCCGVGLFLLVPLILLFVYIRGRSKIIQEEGY